MQEETLTQLAHYTVYVGSSLLTFNDNLPVPSMVKQSKKKCESLRA